MNEGSGDRVWDYSGNGNHGTINADLPQDWTVGPSGYTVSLATNDYVALPSLSAQLAGSAELTVFARSLRTNITADHPLFCRGTTDSHGFILLMHDDACASGVQGSGNTDTFMFNAGATSGAGNRVNGTSASAKANVWQSVAGVMCSSSRLLYVDGLLNASHTSGIDTTIGIDTAAPTLGLFGTTYASASLDMVAVWARALTASAIQQLSADPYALFRPRRRVWRLVPTGYTDYPVSLADSMGWADVPTVRAAYNVAAADSLTLADVPAVSAAYLQSLADSLTVSDAATVAAAYLQSLAGSLALGDALTARAAYLQALSDGLSLSDSASALLGAIVTLADALSASDSWTVRYAAAVTIADTLAIGDSLEARYAASVLLADGLSLADVLAVGERLTLERVTMILDARRATLSVDAQRGTVTLN